MPTPEQRRLAARTAQILALAGLIRGIAGQTGGRSGFEDRVQDGTEGAIQAVDSWNGRGSLSGWASTRIRGAIIDARRKEDWLSRSQRQQAKAGRRMPLRPSSSDELAVHGDYWQPTPEEVDQAAAIDLRDAINLLPDRDRSITIRHYWRGEKMKDIGADIGLTEARVSQILDNARRRMRRKLDR